MIHFQANSLSLQFYFNYPTILKILQKGKSRKILLPINFQKQYQTHINIFIVQNAIYWWQSLYNSIMSEILSKLQTRGRPRKNTDQKLPSISRQLFSQHSAVFYACCMVYVLEVFLKTKQEKRIGHSEGGFTIYEKTSLVYCFDTFEEDLKQWGFRDAIFANRSLYQFVKTANGCAPKLVFKELVTLFMEIHDFIISQSIQSVEQLEASQNRFLNQSQADLNRTYKYIRFTPQALKELRLQKWIGQVNKKSKDLWRPFIKIISYTIFCVQHGLEHNKYLKPFFSDAQHPEDTIIGQLNLEQIVQEKEEKIIHSSCHLGFTKISKSFEDEVIKPPLYSSQKQLSVLDRMPFINLRPITLITIPSNPKITRSDSPLKPHSISGTSEKEDVDEIDHIQPYKKLKRQ